MPLALSYRLGLTGRRVSTAGLDARESTLSRAFGRSLSDGTDPAGAGGFNAAFSAAGQAAAGVADIYHLGSGQLLDAFGAPQAFGAVKLLLIEVDPANTAALSIGGGSWSGPLNGATVTLDPGGYLLWDNAAAGGWPVSAGDTLQILCASAAAYSLTIAGVLAASSPPPPPGQAGSTDLSQAGNPIASVI